MENKQIALNKTIRIGFAIILFLIVSNSLTTFFIMNKMSRSSAQVIHTHQVIEALNARFTLLVDIESRYRGFLYVDGENFITSYRDALTRLNENYDMLVPLIQDNPSQINNLKKLEEFIKVKITWMTDNITLIQAKKAEEVRQRVLTGQGNEAMNNIRSAIGEMARIENELLSQRQNHVKRLKNLSLLFIAGGMILAAICIIFIFVYIARNVMVPVNNAVTVLMASTSDILASVTQHELTSSSQMAAATQTSATIEELSVSSRRSAEQAATSAATAEKASIATENGDKLTRQTVQAINSLKEKIAAMADQILHLGEQTGQIGNIATLVKELSGQINMLALNAAVEAARAGEHGKGFAVVASEVRKLADQSKKSAEQTSNVVADIQKATNSSVMMTEESSRIASEVTQLTQNVAELFNNLSVMVSSVNENAQQVMFNAKQQSAAFVQIVEAVNSISSGARETATGISQTKIGIQKLNEAAENLKNIM